MNSLALHTQASAVTAVASAGLNSFSKVVADALSMAAGEYLSAKAEEELMRMEGRRPYQVVLLPTLLFKIYCALFCAM